MHNWDRRSRIALNDDMAGKRQPRFFCDRKGVHVSAQKYGGTLAVAQHSDHSGAAHARRHFISHCLDAIRQLGCRLLLMHGQLGGSMEIEVEGLHLGINRVDFRARWSCPRYGLGLRGGASKQEHTTGQHGQSWIVHCSPFCWEDATRLVPRCKPFFKKLRQSERRRLEWIYRVEFHEMS